MSAEREKQATTETVRDHCARASDFDRTAVTVEGWLANAPNEEAGETLKVISENWRQLAELHRSDEDRISMSFNLTLER
jgi:hypothetical protein